MKLSEFPTQQILIYAELVSKEFDELYEFDVQVVLCHQAGGLSDSEKNDIRKDIGTKMEELEKHRVLLVKEINTRVKKHLGLKFGPADVQPYINRYVKKYPLIGKGEAEIKMMKEKEKKANLSKA